MNDIRNITNMADRFYQLTRNASVRGNMAKRIMFSLLQHLVPQGESARVALTHGVVDDKALRQMIPGAKELLEYGTAAAIEEARHYDMKVEVDRREESFSPPDNTEYQKLLSIYNSGNIHNTLVGLCNLFAKPDWVPGYGGEKWLEIAKTLLNIDNSILAAEVAKKSYDWEGSSKHLMKMTMYVNILDGLAHNTGDIMQKILDHESQKTYLHPEGSKNNLDGSLDKEDHEHHKQYLEKRQIFEEYRKALKLMDAKELSDPDDVLQEIMPTLENESDAALTMKDWMTPARQRYQTYQGNEIEREKKMQLIRLKKHYLIDIDDLKDDAKKIRSWSMLTDSKLKETIIKNRSFIDAVVKKFNSFELRLKKFMTQTEFNKLRTSARNTYGLLSYKDLYKLNESQISSVAWGTLEGIEVILNFFDNIIT